MKLGVSSDDNVPTYEEAQSIEIAADSLPDLQSYDRYSMHHDRYRDLLMAIETRDINRVQILLNLRMPLPIDILVPVVRNADLQLYDLIRNLPEVAVVMNDGSTVEGNGELFLGGTSWPISISN